MSFHMKFFFGRHPLLSWTKFIMCFTLHPDDDCWAGWDGVVAGGDN